MPTAEKREGKLTGWWYGEVDRRHLSGPRFRRRFETKAKAEGYEAYVRATGEEPAGMFAEGPSGRTFAVVAGELKDAGGPNGVWERGRDVSVPKRLETVCRSSIGNTPIASLSYKTAEAFVTALKKKPGKAEGSTMSPATINRYLSLISAVLTYAEQAGYITTAPHLPWQKEIKRRRQKTYTETQEATLMRYMRSQGWEAEALCIDVLSVSGLRVGELLGLSPDQIEDDFIHLDDPDQIKNEEPRMVHIGEELGRSLRALVASGKLPTYTTLRNRLEKALKACGYEMSRSIHAFRHTTATRTVNNEADVQVAKELLGHKSISTTLRYRHVSKDVLRERAKKTSPRRGELITSGDVVDFAQQKSPLVS